MREREREEQWRFVLYLSTAKTRLSKWAIRHLNEICEEHLKGRYSIEIVDIQEHPEIGIEKKIIASPTLIREQPKPIKKVIGDLSDRKKALAALGIEKKPL